MVSHPAPLPLLPVLAVLLLALALRVVDIFVLRLDERWGEILLSKSLTLALVLGLVLLTGSGLEAIGLRGSGAWRSVPVAALGIVAVFALALAVQLMVFRLQGSQFALSIAAIDPKTAVSGGLGFTLLLLAGNVVNAMAEEGLFRGLFQPALAAHVGFWPAVALQAILFGLWHLVWPAKAVVTGGSTLSAAVGAGLALLVASSVAGFAFGLMYAATGTLWVPIVVHLINNTFYNVVHVRTDAGLDSDVLVMQTVATVGLVAMVPLLRIAGR